MTHLSIRTLVGSAVVCAILAPFGTAGAQCDPVWEEVLAGFGFDGLVRDMAVYGGELYVCGDFTNITGPGGPFPAPRVARWDGATWSAVGTFAFSAGVFDLEVIDLGSGPLLYAAGNFTGRLATWDGATWTAFPVLPGSNVRCVASHLGELYIGGVFADGVRRFNGTAWVAVGNGLQINVAPNAVLDLQVFDGLLHAAGQFTCASAGGGGTLCSNPIAGTSLIARFNGTAWESIDGGVGIGTSVERLTVFPVDGIDSLIAGGRFDLIGGVAANDVASWNSVFGWQALGGSLGTPGAQSVFAFSAFDDRTSGDEELYAAGSFNTPALRVAQHSGNSLDLWTALAGGGVTSGSTVRALATHDDGSGPALYVGGTFTGIPGATVANIARYRAFLGPDCNTNGINDACDIAALTSADCNANTIPDECDVALGTSLDCNGGGIPDECEIAAGAADCDGDGDLDSCELALGAPDCNANGILDGCDIAFGGASEDCEPNGIPDECDVLLGAPDINSDDVPDLCQTFHCLPEWDATLPGLDLQIWASAVFGGDLILGGEFTSDAALTTTLLAVARYDGHTLHAMGDGFDARVRVLAVHDIGQGPQLFAGGDFTATGATPCSHVAVWDGSDWVQVGNGLTAACYDLEVYQGQLYAAGSFGQRVRRFDTGSQTWVALAAGVTGGTNGVVYTLEVFDEGLGAGPELFAGGDFECVGDTAVDCSGATAVAAENIAKWNGTSWAPVGGGMTGLPEHYVWKLAALDLGGGPELFAGGYFTTAGAAAANGIAVWSDAPSPGSYAWSDLAGGVGSSTATLPVVRAIALFDEGIGSGPELVIGGSFNIDASAGQLRRVARYTGSAWVELDAGVTGQVLTLEEHTVAGQRSLHVGGNLTAASGAAVDGLAAWDAALSARGTDCNTNSVPDDCDIAIGTSEDCDADLVPDECQPDCNGSGAPDVCDLAGGTSLDCNANGTPDECDIAIGVSIDCNGNGVPDDCDLAAGAPDCNGNLIPDSCDIAVGVSSDCNGNGVPDTCDLAGGGAADCNGNAIPDSCDIAAGTSFDCNGNTIPDSCDVGSGSSPDCNGNLVPDSCDIAVGTSLDCNGNTIPDSCDIAAGAPDCNGNLVPDSCDIAAGTSLDCNGNTIPDSCELLSGAATDCNANGVLDSCDIASGTLADCDTDGIADLCELIAGLATDCNSNNVLDSCDIAAGVLPDCNANAIADLCELISGTALDCNANANLDSCDLAAGTSADCDVNGVPDECDPDCDADGLVDACELAGGAADCNANGTLDNCDIAAGSVPDCNLNGVPDGCDLAAGTPDCNGNGVPDSCDIDLGTSADCNANGIPDGCEADCNGNGTPDSCDIADGTSDDCDGNGVPDPCDLSSGAAGDCDGDGTLDSCEVAAGAADCNANGIPDTCDIASGTSQDVNLDGIPDECFASFVRGNANADAMVNIADAVFTISFLFIGGLTPPCLDAADINDDTFIDISDPIYLIGYQFLSGSPPLAPFPACGTDPTADTLDCINDPNCP